MSLRRESIRVIAIKNQLLDLEQIWLTNWRFNLTRSQDTQPVFIIGSGRSGTRSMFKMLQGTSNVEVHHEFICTQVQQLAALYSMSLINKTEVINGLRGLHYSAVYWSEARIWIDSSNKLMEACSKTLTYQFATALL